MFDLSDAVKQMKQDHMKTMALQTFRRILTTESMLYFYVHVHVYVYSAQTFSVTSFTYMYMHVHVHVVCILLPLFFSQRLQRKEGWVRYVHLTELTAAGEWNLITVDTCIFIREHSTVQYVYINHCPHAGKDIDHY